MPRDLTPEEAARQVRWSDPASRDALQLIAEGVTQVAGFGIAAISVVRDGALESVAIAGNDEARKELEGTRTTVERVLAELEKADDWGLLRFVPHERLDPGAGDTWGWVPDIEPIDAPDAWDPMDLLIAPLYDASGTLRGTLAMDLPVDGLRPGRAQREVLNTYAEQAGRAVVVALEREALADQVRMAQAARRIVRKATAQLSLERIFADSTEAMIDGFRAAGMWIQTFSDEGQGLVLSADGLDVDLSPELRRIAEHAAREAWLGQQVAIIGRGRPWLDPITEEQGELILAFLDRIGVSSLMFIPLGAGPVCLGNLALTRLEGGPAWTEAEAAAALDIGHDLGHAILNARTFEREHQLVEELQALDAYKGQLIATVAHELKNPLTSVLGHLEMLDASPDFSGTSKSSLATMERGAQRMVRVIEDLLLLAKVGDANTPLISVPVDLHRTLEEVIDLNTVAARQKDITLVVESPDEPMVAIGDPDELDRICSNLVSNAVKYTPDGGTVTVTLAHRGDRIELSCADTGIGIAADDLARLGTEFFRSSNPEAVAQPGTGLGLAIVHRIVARHGGDMTVESDLGQGSTFRVSLPAA
jgi:signal transduction histidine kinase